MDNKDKKGDFSIKTTFESWLDIEGQDKVTFVFGNTSVGKSTICLLMNKVIDNDPNPNLKLVEKKKDWEYECEGEINPKSLKPLTIYPKKFQIKSKNISIVEVPSRVYSLQKKRPFIDKLLNIIGMVHCAKKANFIFAVDAKNTSGKCQPWKRTFQTIFDCFDGNLLNQKTFKSVGFVVISKSTSNDLEKDIFLNRMEDLQSLITEQKKDSSYLQLIKTIKEQKNLSVFKKTTQNQQAINQDIEQIFKMIQKIEKESIEFQNQSNQCNDIINISPVMLEKEEQNCFDKFNETFTIIMNFFSSFFAALFENQSPINLLNFQQKDSQKENVHYLKKYWPLQINSEHKEQKIVREKLNNLKIKSAKNKLFYQHLLGKASLLMQYKQKILLSQGSQKNTLANFLQILAEHGLIEQSSSQVPQLESLYLELIQYSIFQQRFGPYIKNLNYKQLLTGENFSYQFRDLNHKNVRIQIHKSIVQKRFSFIISPLQAQKFLKIIDDFFPKEQIVDQFQKSIPQLKNNLSLTNFDNQDPKVAIVQICKFLTNIFGENKVSELQNNRQNQTTQVRNEVKFLNNFAFQVAKVLGNIGYPEFSAEIYRDCGKIHSSIRCYKQTLKKKKIHQSQNFEDIYIIIDDYIQLLIEEKLYQKAIEQCNQLAEIYQRLRKLINQKKNEVNKRRHQPLNERKGKQNEERFLGESTKLSSLYTNKQIFSKIKHIAQNIGKETF